MLFTVSSKSNETSKLLVNLNLGQSTSRHLLLSLTKAIYTSSTWHTFGDWQQNSLSTKFSAQIKCNNPTCTEQSQNKKKKYLANEKDQRAHPEIISKPNGYGK